MPQRVAASTSGAVRPLAVLGGRPRFVEPLYVTRPRLPERKQFTDLIDAIFDRRWLTNDGTLVRELEDKLRHRLGVGFCAAFCNGTIGLLVALRSLGIRGEVITTPFTFPATVHAIEWSGLTPVFCDVDPDTYNLDPTLAAELVSERTSALLPVHVFGTPCDVVAIDRLAAARGLRVVYDAAHAFGVEAYGRPIGCWGDLSVFSFHATKLFHTAEGGAVVGPDAERATEIRLLRNFGIVNEEEVRGVGVNGKLSELHAAVGLTVFDQVDEEIAARGRLAAHYRERLADIDGLRVLRSPPSTRPNNGYFVIEIDSARFGLSRDTVHLALRAENIITRKYFHPLCSTNSAYAHLPSAAPDRLPVAHRLASRILCLPLYGDLQIEDVDRIADCLIDIRAAADAVRRACTQDGP